MQAHPKAKQIDIICELFGGNYHGDKIPNSKTIQNGKYANYSKDNDIRVFDIHLDDLWLSWDQVIEFGGRWGLPLVPEVFRGLWEHVKDFNVETFQSLLANQINEDNSQDNPAEGVVLRLETPSTQDHRDMRIKWKCEEMLEGATYKPKDIRCNIENIERYLSMMDQVRFDNFKTKKIFEFNDAIIGKNIGWLVNDVIKDIQDDNPKIDIKTLKSLRGPLSKQAKRFIFEYMKTL